MLPQEYLLLNTPRLSHPARTLYVLHLRRQALQHSPITLNYPELGRALAVEDATVPGGFSYQVNAKQLTQLLNELIQVGLIEIEQPVLENEHFHGKAITLPILRESRPIPVKQSAFALFPEWRPDDGFSNLARMCGLIDVRYDETDLGEFIAYWLGHPDRFETQHQWMLKFIKQLKSKRYRKPIQETVGYQTTQATTISQNEPSQRAREMMARVEQLKHKATEDDDE